MRVVLHPTELFPHLSFLRAAPGAYEWWYFDALSSDRRYALACIWFLGNPFSPYYRLAAQGKDTDPLQHNALFFALYEGNTLHAYHFSRFRKEDICVDREQDALLRFGPNSLRYAADHSILDVRDENANRRALHARLTFTAPPMPVITASDDGSIDDGSADEHLWCPAAPACVVTGQMRLRGLGDGKDESIVFQGDGYHDHNRGRLPFSRALRDWYWARAILDDGSAIIVYHVRHTGQRESVTHLLRFQNGRLLRHDARAHTRLSRPAINAFGRVYATRLDVTSDDWHARFLLRGRLDSAPFYVRTRTDVLLTVGDVSLNGSGLGEWFRPHPLSSSLVASATKARIVEQD